LIDGISLVLVFGGIAAAFCCTSWQGGRLAILRVDLFVSKIGFVAIPKKTYSGTSWAVRYTTNRMREDHSLKKKDMEKKDILNTRPPCPLLSLSPSAPQGTMVLQGPDVQKRRMEKWKFFKIFYGENRSKKFSKISIFPASPVTRSGNIKVRPWSAIGP